VIADHTAVARGLEGQGVGRRLLDRLLEDARTEGFKIIPLCPFANTQRHKHLEWADLFNV
jgi:predicted GNAT family acetyltransferase